MWSLSGIEPRLSIRYPVAIPTELLRLSRYSGLIRGKQPIMYTEISHTEMLMSSGAEGRPSLTSTCSSSATPGRWNANWMCKLDGAYRWQHRSPLCPQFPWITRTRFWFTAEGTVLQSSRHVTSRPTTQKRPVWCIHPLKWSSARSSTHLPCSY
jgi:hypothetical protein